MLLVSYVVKKIAHSADNTFLGFVVHLPALNRTGTTHTQVLHRQNAALVYGKEAYMWKDHGTYLDLVHEQAQVWGTVQMDSTHTYNGHVPDYVHNYGVLNTTQFHSLLSKTKIFLGLGFPYEGPAALEAIANGAVYLNPSYTRPKGRLTDQFFYEKPTLRQLSSQNPYLEHNVGSPHVLTVDISNATAVRHAVQTALLSNVAPYLPFEFTATGMLQRMAVLIQKQDFCGRLSDWPPFVSAKLHTSRGNESCEQTCLNHGLYCERSYFSKINTGDSLGEFANCTQVSAVSDIRAPFYLHKQDGGSAMDSAGADTHAQATVCAQQSSPLLFSCAASALGTSNTTAHNHTVHRLCPCRDGIRGQVQLCEKCV